MTSSFILAVDPAADVSDQELIHFLNARPEIVNWVEGFYRLYILVLENSGSDKLTDVLLSYFKKNGRERPPSFMVIPVKSGKVQGMMPKVTWNTIRSVEPLALPLQEEDEIPF